MLNFFLTIFSEVFTIIADTSVYLFFGFLLAGLINVYLPPEKVAKFFGKRDMRSVMNASLFGLPLPLCSCSVLPTAIALRKGGASKGSVFSFLISTPETSVPSIGISFALLDPLMTIFRPIAAFLTAILAGFGINIIDRKESVSEENSVEKENSNNLESAFGADNSNEETTSHKLLRAVHFTFVDLLDDLAPWLIIGIFAAGVISAIVPESFFSGYLSSGITPMLLMLAIGLPLYVCAEGSTPIAAALILKGLSPGAAFVFLLVGPATNIGSLVVLSKFFSKKVLALYLTTIAIMALVLGGILNTLYSFFNISIAATVGSASSIIPSWLRIGAAVLLTVMLAISLYKTNQYSRIWNWSKSTLGWTGGRLVKALLILIAIVYLSDGLFVVPAGGTGMSMTFGKVTRSELAPGLYYRLPTPFGQHAIIQTDLIRSLEIGFRRTADVVSAVSQPVSTPIMLKGEKLDKLSEQDMPKESELLAGDENLIDMDITIHYRIDNAYKAAFKIDNIEQLLRELATYHVLLDISTRQVSDELTAERADFEIDVANMLQKSIDDIQIGLEIIRVNVVYGHPPDVVHSAFRDVASAMEDKFRLVNLAQTDSISSVASARSSVKKRLSAAQADSAKIVSVAVGESNRFTSISTSVKSRRRDQEFRMNAEAAESTLVNLEKILVLTDDSGTLDLIIMPESIGNIDNLPPEVIQKLQSSYGSP